MEKCLHCGLIKLEHRESDGACPVYEAPQYSTGNLFHTQNGFHNVNKFVANTSPTPILKIEKCFHCGTVKGEHRASDNACPIVGDSGVYKKNRFQDVNKFFAIPSSVEGFTTPMPRRTWLWHRINELLTAITQYVETDNCKSSIDHWIDELKKNIEEWNV